MVEEMIYTKEELREIDKELEMIPLTFDSIFKGVFERNLDILKQFLIITLGLELETEKTTIQLLNNELLKDNFKEYQKTVDILVVLNEHIYVDIEINRSNFEKVKLRNILYSDKIFSSLLERGDDVEILKDTYFYQLNLNTEDKTISYGEEVVVAYGIKTKSVFMDHKYIVLKYLEFYRHLYYTNNESLKEDEIWLAALTSRNFIELNEMLSHILSNKEKNEIIGEAIRMSKDFINIHEWEKEKCDQLVKLESKRIDYEEGLEHGVEEGIEQNTVTIILAMLENNFDLESISKVTKKSIEEIKQIQEKNNN